MARPRPSRLLLLAGLAALLGGCAPQESPFRNVDGTWHYNKTPISQADAKTFEVLADHYAKDRARVYHADTYRDGREYYMVRHDRVIEIAGAKPASFRYIAREYARDAANVYFEGVRMAVADPASFELLDDGFARDRTSGYCHQAVVAGSDGATFVGIDARYAKDARRVFHCAIESDGGARRPYVNVVALPGAQPASFRALDSGYAADANQVYYRDRVLSRDAASIVVLAADYAKTAVAVYYRGDVVRGADPATFATLDVPTDVADASDAAATYLLGTRTPKVAAAGS
jgi:hypothetical protein